MLVMSLGRMFIFSRFQKEKDWIFAQVPQAGISLLI